MAEVNGVDKTVLESHRQQLESSGVPQIFWPALFRKIIKQEYDAGGSFQVCQLSYAEGEREEGDSLWEVVVIKPGGIKTNDPENIFLIDHAWTYQAHEARHCLNNIPGLLERMASLMDIPNNNDRDAFVTSVLNKMWKFNGTYSIAGKRPEDSQPVWYVMDEFGVRIQHSGEPNFKVVPFYFTPHLCCYALLFPLQDTDTGEEVTRNYVESEPVDSLIRDAQMLPWFPVDLSHVDPTQEEPTEKYFQAVAVSETLPDAQTPAQTPPTNRPLKVYAEYKFVVDYLKDSRFVLTDDREDADILWLTGHYKDFRGLREKPTMQVNQFPAEHLLTVKDLLAVVCRRAAAGLKNQQENGEIISKEESESLRFLPEDETDHYPTWLPLTYCLKNELVKFVSVFQRRQKRGTDNVWIVKPWNLGRGLDITITDNLDHILRLPSTGPKIAQRYLSDPVLFHREDIDAEVKFDVRYIVMLLSVNPLKVAVYRRFWIRFANEPFDLTELDNSQKHFTVNNYNDAFLLQMYCHDFISKFNQQHPEHPWELAEKDIFTMIHQVFKSATLYDHPRGIPHNPQCKGCYGFDIMLEWTRMDCQNVMHPKLLEINFQSDCKRACEYYPEFFDDIFAVMFLDETEGHNVSVLQ